MHYKYPNEHWKSFKICLVNWDGYDNVLMSGPGDKQWHELVANDCIICDIDLNMEYL